MPPPPRKPGTLSNGTLSLKFMQRALIAENKTPVEAEKAEMVDDSKWFIDSTTQQATWLEPQSSTSVVYESSSLPFIFGSSSPESGSGTRPFKGRRKFVNGQEKDMVFEGSSQPLTANPDEHMEAPSAPGETQRKPKPTKGISRQQTQAARPLFSSDRAMVALPYDLPTPVSDSVAPPSTSNSAQVSLDPSSQFLRPADVHVPARSKSKRDILSDLIKSSRESAKQSPTPPVETLKPSPTSTDYKESKRRKGDPISDIDRPKKKTKRPKSEVQTVNPP